jgi:hypothetical protein
VTPVVASECHLPKPARWLRTTAISKPTGIFIDGFELSERDIERFWSKFKRNEQTGCLEWMASTNGGGYGRLIISVGPPGGRVGIQFPSHRLAFAIGHRRDPGKYLVCHKCDNRICGEPEHLFEGTPLLNTRDALEKGRLWRGDKGTQAKLTELQARFILSTDESTVVLSRRFGVCVGTIKSIRGGKSWKHLHSEASK